MKEKRLKRKMLYVFLVPLGSVPELPAESCAEIRASEGEDVITGLIQLNLERQSWLVVTCLN